MKKILSIALTVSCAVWMTGLAMIPISAATIVEGDIVSPDAEYTDDDGNMYYPYDVFIIKYVGDKKFKRLVLNPQVFESYGHLEWSNIKTVTVDELKAFTTADLVRADGDDKVYKLYPDGDSGTKKWVETLDCFNTQGFDWDSVYLINSVDRDNYATGVTMCGGGDGGDITLSVASDNPDAATLPPNAQGVTFLKVNVTGTGTVNQVTFKRSGAGATADFGDLYVYEDGVRLTSGRSLSSSNSKVSFINLGLQAPTSFELVADMSTGSAGNVNYFEIETSSDVTTDATVGGAFPLQGNPMGISATSAGTLTVERAGASSRNVIIGEQGVEITQFKVSSSTEGTHIHRVQLFNSGTVSNNLITNLELRDNTGVVVATADEIGDDGYVAFVFDDPYYIKKGDSEIFRVFADIGGVKPERTILLYLELATDILGIGTTYGYGMAASIGSYDSDAYVTVTCKGGDLTLNKVGPNAGKIGTDTDDTVLLEFTMSAAADITIKRTRIFLCIDAAGDGTYDTTSGSADLEDIKITDKDSGTIIVGPKDGTDIDDAEIDDGCGTALGADYEDFTDTFDISTGETKTLQLTVDVKTANSDSGTVVAAGAKLKGYLYSYATLVGTTGNVSYMKYTGTTDAVDDSAIAPSGHIAGEEMTVESASLAISLAAAPSGGDTTNDEKVYVKGQPGVDAVGIIFTAGTASDITVNSISLVSFILEYTGGTWAAGKDTNYVKDSIGSVYIYDKDADAMVPGSTAKGFTSGDDYEHTDYTGLDWTIPAGEDKTLLVKVDVSSAAPASGTGDVDTWIAFDIENVTDVSAVDKDGNSVSIATADPNGGTTPTTNFGIVDYGSLAIDDASDTPDKSLVIMGTSDNEVSKFKLTGTYEGWYLEKFSVVLDDGQGVDSDDRDNFTAVKVKYQTEDQWGTENWTISSGKTFGANASLGFAFSGDDRIYVPKDDDTYVSVLTSIDDYSGGTAAKSKVPFKMYDIDGSTSSLLAYGSQSGKQLTDFGGSPADSDAYKLHFVTRSKPVFAKSAWSGAELELARFTITAEGGDVFFDGQAGTEEDIATACLRFDIVASSQGPGAADASGDLTLYDWNENTVASIDDVTWGNGSAVVSVSFVFEEEDVTVPSGTTKEFHIDMGAADVADFIKTDEYVYLQFRNDDGGDLATGSMYFGGRDIVWDDKTNEEGISGEGNPEERYGMPGLIKNIGPLPITFRTYRGTGTP